MSPRDPAEKILYLRVHGDPSRSNHGCVTDDDDQNGERRTTAGTTSPHMARPLLNFALLSILFSANHGAMVSCLAFTTLQLGARGAWQLVLLHLVYGASSLLGATLVVKQFGCRNSMIFGMSLYAVYIGCFWISLHCTAFVNVFAVLGALVAGVGGALMWTAQGSYFHQASQDFAYATGIKSDDSTSYLAGVFACIYLVLEVACKLVSWLLLQSKQSQWTTVFGVYTIVAIVSTIGMIAIHNYPASFHDTASESICYKMTATWQLLRYDPKVKYLVGLNAVFGFAYPFVNSYVNGEVIHQVMPQDWGMHDVGLFSAISSAVAALCSLTFGKLAATTCIGKGPILVGGAISFAAVALVFIVYPNLDEWGWAMLVLVYCFQGIGRSTVEGALRATVVDFFPKEVEGAFANVILQNGLFTSFGFFLSFSVGCSRPGPYCVEYKEGGLHNILVLEVAVVVSAIVAVLGYWKASLLYRAEECERLSEDEDEASYMMISDEGTREMDASR